MMTIIIPGRAEQVLLLDIRASMRVVEDNGVGKQGNIPVFG